MQAILERRHHAEVAAAAAETPEEVGVRFASGGRTLQRRERSRSLTRHRDRTKISSTWPRSIRCSTGGTVYAVPPAEMPDPTEAAAVLRY
jgi:hypothetical protein